MILHAEKKDNENNDFITNLVKRFLPTPEDIGLKRFDQSSRPESFPCVKDEWAALLPEDKRDKDIQLIRQLLAKTNLEFRPLQLAYDANRDGWNSEVFHSKVDKRGPAVVLARTQSGDTIGGYNPTGWVNYGEYRGSIAAFLFVFPKNNVSPSSRPIKLAKISGAGLAQIDDGSGPKFGMEGLTISLEKRSPKKIRSKLGLYYEKMPDGRNSLLSGKMMEDELLDLKVFLGVYGKEEKIPYSDAIPFALN